MFVFASIKLLASNVSLDFLKKALNKLGIGCRDHADGLSQKFKYCQLCYVLSKSKFHFELFHSKE